MAARGNNPGDLNIALRMDADLRAGVQALDQLERGLKDVGRAGDEAGNAAAGLNRTSEAADAATERLQRMVQASLERQRALDAQRETETRAVQATREGAAADQDRVTQIERVNQAYEAQRATVTEQIRAIGELNERIARGAASREELAETELLIDQQMQAGLLTQEEQLQMLEALDRQERALIATRDRQEKQVRSLLRVYDPASAALRKLEEDERRLKEAVDAGLISREEYNRAIVGLAAQREEWEKLDTAVDNTSRSFRTARVDARSVASVLRNLATGNVSQAGGSALTLGTQAATGFSALALAITGAVGLLGVFAIAAVRGTRELREIERALLATGTATGLTASSFQDLSRDIDDATGRVGRGRQALLALVSTGQATAETLEIAGTAAIRLADLTGRSVEDTAREIGRLMEDPARAAADLTRQYHFLTAAQFQRIEALQREGNLTEAGRVAVEALGDTLRDRTDEMVENLGSVERAWDGVRNAAVSAWEFVKDIGREGTTGDQIRQVERDLAVVERLIAAERGRFRREAHEQRRDALLRELALLQEISESEEEAAQKREEEQRKQATGVAALYRRLAQFQDRAVDRAQALAQLETDINAIREAGIDTIERYGISLEEFARRWREQIEAQFAERGASEADREARQREEFVSQLERQASLLGLNRQQVLQYEIAERRLTGALRERAEAAAQALAADERRQQMEADAEQLAQAQVQFLRATGRHAEAANMEIERRYDALLVRLNERGDAAGAELIGNLISAERARTALGELQTEFDRFTSRIARDEQRINIERQNGLISATEAQRRLLDLRHEEIAQLRELLTLLEAQNALLADPAVEQQIEQLRLRLFELENQAGLLAATFRNAFEESLGRAIVDLATRTGSLRDAMVGLLEDMTRSMANFAAQQLASIATARLMQAIMTRSGSTPNLYQPDPGQAAAAGTAYALPIQAAGATLTAAGSVTLQAAVQMQAAAQTLMVANSMSSAGGGAFSAGGYTGVGAVHEVAGVVHRGEYVQPAARVREPGALSFMELFRAHGMRAVERWRGYAGGGLVVDGPSMTSQLAAIGPRGTSAGAGPESIAAMLALEPGLVLREMKTSDGVNVMVHNMSRNPSLFRSALGV